MTTTESTRSDAARALFSAIDSGQFDVIAGMVSEDVRFRFGNAEPTDTKAALAEASQAFLGSIAGIRHEIHDLWEVEDDGVVAVMDVHYERLDGTKITLPCCNVFRFRDDRIHDYRIYMDVNPVSAA